MDGKLDINRLRSLQAMSLGAKVARTRNKITEWVEHWGEDGVYLSTSGGKDSRVLVDIAQAMYPDIALVFCDTGLEYPEVRDAALSHGCVAVLKPQMKFKEVLSKYGYPVVSKQVAMTISRLSNPNIKPSYRDMFLGAIQDDGRKSKFALPAKWHKLMDAPFRCSEQCCDVMKKRPFARYEKETGRKPMIGTMAYESTNREEQWAKHGCNAFDLKKPHSNPLSFWTEQDILQYIRENDIAIPSVYGEQVQRLDETWKLTGCDRTGCMFCMFGVHMEKGRNRFQRMYETHPKQWAYCMDKLGCRKVLEFIGVKCGDEVEAQLDMFNNTKETT